MGGASLFAPQIRKWFVTITRQIWHNRFVVRRGFGRVGRIAWLLAFSYQLLALGNQAIRRKPEALSSKL